jgi:tetratricopeptide (TPR) repeat protein
MEASDSDAAYALLETILERDPENTRALSEKGAWLVATGDVSEGEALIRRAIAHNPSDIEANYKLYLCLCGQPGREKDRELQREVHQKIEQDNKRLTKILSHDMNKSPGDANLHHELGMIFYRKGKKEIAVRWLTSALKLDPAHKPSRDDLREILQGKEP